MRRISIFIATVAVFGALAAPTGASTTKTINWTFGTDASVSIKKGDSVKWVWSGGPHNVAGSSTSGSPRSGGSYTRKFTSKGTFKFYCKPHKAIMNATVRVS